MRSVIHEAVPSVLRWEEPPPPGNRGGRPSLRCWEAVADELRGRYGEWAVVYEGPDRGHNGLSVDIRHGVIAAFRPSGDFDAVTRQRDGIRTVYARFLGDGEG